MDVVAAILTARISGVVRCGLSALPRPSVLDVAAEFGLLPERDAYRQVEATAAHTAVRDVLHRDLAYSGEIMPAAEADRLAAAFLDLFGGAALYFTNTDGDNNNGWSWFPVTAATFDTGVIAIGPERSGCLWVEDED